MELNKQFYKVKEDSKVYWLSSRELQRACSFDKKKIYYLPADYEKMTDEERALLDEESAGLWRRLAGY